MKRIMLAIFSVILIQGCVSAGGTRIDNIPMYGQPDVQRPEMLKKADEDFIKEATKGFGSRKEASRAWHVQAEKFMNEGNFDYAMRRYNQSWLLDPQNYQPYWGFARILMEQNKFDEAIRHLEKSKSLIDDQYQKVALLSDIGAAYSHKAISIENGNSKLQYFQTANQYFAESTSLDQNYSESWRRWAYSLYEQGNYPETWEKIKKARSIGARPFPEAFINAINAKMPEPK